MWRTCSRRPGWPSPTAWRRWTRAPGGAFPGPYGMRRPWRPSSGRRAAGGGRRCAGAHGAEPEPQPVGDGQDLSAAHRPVPGSVRAVAPTARRAGAAGSGACDCKAEEPPAYRTYAGAPTTRRGPVPGTRARHDPKDTPRVASGYGRVGHGSEPLPPELVADFAAVLGRPGRQAGGADGHGAVPRRRRGAGAFRRRPGRARPGRPPAHGRPRPVRSPGPARTGRSPAPAAGGCGPVRTEPRQRPAHRAPTRSASAPGRAHAVTPSGGPEAASGLRSRAHGAPAASRARRPSPRHGTARHGTARHGTPRRAFFGHISQIL